MNNLKSNVWEDPEIIEIQEEISQEKVDGNLDGPYSVINATCSTCY